MTKTHLGERKMIQRASHQARRAIKFANKRAAAKRIRFLGVAAPKWALQNLSYLERHGII